MLRPIERKQSLLEHCDQASSGQGVGDALEGARDKARGLLLDLLTTADRVRVEDAMERFIFLLRWHADERASVPHEG